MKPANGSRVYVTGVGVLLPDGAGMDTVRRLLSGLDRPAHGAVPPREDAAPDVRLIDDLPTERFAGRRQIRLMDRAMSLCVAAAGLAFEDASISPELIEERGGEIATILGSMQGELPALFRFGRPLFEGNESSVNPAHFPMIGSNIACGQVALTFGLGGWSSMVSCGEISGLHALSRAAHWVASGRGSMALVGAYETFSRLTIDWIRAHGASGGDAHSQQRVCAPTTECACFLVLENDASIELRSAQSYGRIGRSISGYQYPATRQRAVARVGTFIEQGSVGGSGVATVFSGRGGAAHDDGFELEMIDRLGSRFGEVREVATRGAFGEAGSVNVFLQALAAMLDKQSGAPRLPQDGSVFVTAATTRGGYGVLELSGGNGRP